jgi:hypothetical protein
VPSANNGYQDRPDLAARSLVNQSYRVGMCCRPKLAKAFERRSFERRCAFGADRPATNLRTRRCCAASSVAIATCLSCREWARHACVRSRRTRLARDTGTHAGSRNQLVGLYQTGNDQEGESVSLAAATRRHRGARAGQCRSWRNHEEVTSGQERFSIGKIMQWCR